MQRRDFLKAVPAIAASASAAGQIPAPKKADITSSVMLWTIEGSFEQKLETVARAGLQSIELVYEHARWSDADIRRTKSLARSYRLGIDTISAVPFWKKMPVSMVDPSQRENLLQEVEKNIVYAQKLEVPMLLLMSGLEVAGLSREEQFANLVESCERCGELAAKADVKLVVEPLNNKVETPGFFLTTCVDGLRLIRQVDNPHVRLLFDIYHEQVQTGNVIETIRQAADHTEIYHVADSPGRHEPGTGELYYPNIYKAIQETGHRGYVTMEYLPTEEPARSLLRSVDEMRAGFAEVS